MDTPLARGSARCTRGPSAQEILHRDGRPVAPLFEVESPRFLGDEDIPFDRYTSRALYDREMERMWTRTWQWACREEHIPTSGDYYVYEVGRHSVIVLRTESGEVKAYINSCLHRGTKFRPGSTDGHMTELRCPFHGWTWSLEGELKRYPCPWDAPHVDPAKFTLPEVQVGLWAGFVFINMDPDAPPLADYLAPLPEQLDGFAIQDRFVEIHIEKELYSNWKSAKEAFVENYHTQETHPQLLGSNSDEATQYDVFSPTTSRFIAPFGVSSTHLDTPMTEQELVDAMLIGNRSKLEEPTVVQPGENARIVMARMLRETLGEAYGVDLSQRTDAEMIDVAEYGVFPNMLLFPCLSLPMVYRFRPIGDDVNRSLFELLVLRPVPDNGPRPEPAQPIRLTEEESFTTVPGFDPILGHVYDQDTSNVRAQQEGFYAARKKGETLLNYQEVRVRLLHQTLDTYLAD
jgi:phenylpropionate dioxygenase-like ring-hydroxylating dioxygenase large terminal subunit